MAVGIASELLAHDDTRIGATFHHDVHGDELIFSQVTQSPETSTLSGHRMFAFDCVLKLHA